MVPLDGTDRWALAEEPAERGDDASPEHRAQDDAVQEAARWGERVDGDPMAAAM
jgi:hypothetical protein